jgi:riboflavin kinase/FMN adenylyltransferase
VGATTAPVALTECDDWPHGPIHLCVGEFDGVHIGHRAALAELRRGADAAGATALAMTFDPIPVEFFAPETRSALTDREERVRLLFAAGAGAVTVLRFDDDLSHQLPEEFVQHLVDAGDLRRIIVGADFRFGHERRGDVRTLVGIGARRGFRVDVVQTVYSDGRIVSSALVRNALLAGDMVDAARLLGRPFTLTAHAVAGARRRGQGLGHPAVDLTLPADRIVPRDGVYAVWARLGTERVPAVANLSLRATGGGGIARHLEIHLLDRETVLRDDAVEISFARRLRDELRFPSGYELSQQIARDIVAARAALEEG